MMAMKRLPGIQMGIQMGEPRYRPGYGPPAQHQQQAQQSVKPNPVREMANIPSFVFGGNTGVSYGDLQQQRRNADAIRASMKDSPTDLWSGLSHIGKAIFLKIAENRADETEKKGREQYSNVFQQIMADRMAGKDVSADVASLAGNRFGTDAQQEMLHQMWGNYFKNKERKVVEGADGYKYYQDSGERVLPGVEKPQELTPEMKRYQWAMRDGFGGTFLEYQQAEAGAKRAPQQVQPTQLARLMNERDALPEGDPRRAVYDAQIAKQTTPHGTRLEVDANGNITYAQGAGMQGGQVAATKSTVNNLQKDNASSMQMLQQLNGLANSYKAEYLGAGADARQRGLRFRDRLDASGMSPVGGLNKDQTAWLAGRTKFTQETNRLFNEYRRQITGAAASVQELSSLKDAMLNTDLGPTEFQAAYQSFRDETMRAIRLRNRLMREGYAVGSQQFGKALDSGFGAGADDDAFAHFQHLMNQGASEDQAINQLRALGYDLSTFEGDQ